MPREATESERVSEEMPIPASAVNNRPPMIKCRVVYLGAMRNKSVSLLGKIVVDRFDHGDGTFEEIREASVSGAQCYDFSTHDRLGNVIESRLIEGDHRLESVRRKPFTMVEHLDHLAWFFGERGSGGEREFEILATPAEHAMILAHVKQRSVVERERERLLEGVVNR